MNKIFIISVYKTVLYCLALLKLEKKNLEDMLQKKTIDNNKKNSSYLILLPSTIIYL